MMSSHLKLVIVVAAWSTGFLGGCRPQSESSEWDLEGLASEKLPSNEGFSDYLTGVEYYQNIGRAFPETGVAINPAQLEISWPLEAKRKTLLTHFGTPTLIVTEETATAPSSKIGFLHAALDIQHDQAEGEVEVRAPVSGLGAVVSFRGLTPPFAYDAAVVIREEVSGLLVGLLHVDPLKDLFYGDQKVYISKGMLIGHLGKMVPLIDSLEYRYRHTHLSVIDMESRTLLNPLLFVNQYNDSQSPLIKGAYLLDERGQQMDGFSSKSPGTADEHVDLVVEAFDRDDDSDPNFEVAALSASVTDEKNQVIWSVENCRVDVFAASEMTGHTPVFEFVDLGNALGQAQRGIWRWGGGSDSSNVDRSFRYVVNRLRVDAAGQCHTDGPQLGVLAGTAFWDVNVKMWDASGNMAEKAIRILRR